MRKSVAHALACACLVGLNTAVARADLVTTTPIGTPNWQPVDFHLFSAHFGDDFSLFQNVLQSLLPPPHHQFDPIIGIIPGARHRPPYNMEMAAGVAANGYVDRNVFRPEDFTVPSGVLLAFMVVPAPGTTGSSPDFASGPIIPNSQFPFTITSDILLNGESVVDPSGFQVPPLTEFNPPFFVDGHSHIPFFQALATFPDGDPSELLGNWEIVWVITDQQENGYRIQAPFTIAAVPEPSSLMLVGLGFVGLGIRCWHGRWVCKRRGEAGAA